MEEYEQSIGQSGKIGASLHEICQAVDTCFSTSGLESNNNISMLSMSTNPAAHSVHRAAAGSLPLPELVPRQAQKPYRKWSLRVDAAAAFRLPQQLQQAAVEEEELCALRNALPLLAIERASAQRQGVQNQQ